MLKRSVILISAPLMLFAAALLDEAEAASKGEVLEAFSVIVRADTIERKCGFLGTAESEELGQYAAVAEVAAAGIASVDEVTATREAARGSGERAAASCGQQSRAQVQESLVGVREAMTRARSGSTTARRRSTPPDPTEGRPAPAPSRERVAAVPGEARDALARYAAQTKAYFVERTCGHLGYNRTLAFWRALTGQHAALVRRYGRSAVARAQGQAQREAAQIAARCDMRTRAMVTAAYRDLALN